MPLTNYKQTNPTKVAKLRALRAPPAKVKAVVYAGTLKNNVPLAVQFTHDCMVYGVWEALLYIEGYEREGYYTSGTADKAFNS